VLQFAEPVGEIPQLPPLGDGVESATEQETETESESESDNATISYARAPDISARRDPRGVFDDLPDLLEGENSSDDPDYNTDDANNANDRARFDPPSLASSYDYDSNASEENEINRHLVPSFHYGCRRITKFTIRTVHVIRTNPDCRSVDVEFKSPDGTPCAATVPLGNFNERALQLVYASRHEANPGLGEILDVNSYGQIFWRVLGVLDYHVLSDKVLVSWAGTSKPHRQWVPREDLTEPYDTLEKIQQEIAKYSD
jgi:hypothetical protein